VITSPRLTLSVVVTTYEWPDALDHVLRSLFEQTDEDFEIVIADDGSGRATREVAERWSERFGDRLLHVWQADRGYRRARVLDLAALSASGQYLVFLDGDCLVRRRFVEAVRRAALPGWFLASKRVNLSPELSRRVLESHVPVWRWTAPGWFLRAPAELLAAPRQSARPGLLLPIRDRRRPWRARQPEFTPPYDGYGFFFGVSRADFERVNGFDMRFEGWGGEDVDIALRLRRDALRCGWPGAHATVLHLWHPAKKGTTRSNAPLLDDTTNSARYEAVEGVRELAEELTAGSETDRGQG
jgi:glycosyltransferase involved in cell wall biosynthesis